MADSLEARTRQVWNEVQGTFDVGGFTVDDHGSNSRVLLAGEPNSLVPQYAIKIPQDDTPSAGSQLVEEARILARLSEASLSLNTPRVHAISTDPSYLVMDFLLGEKINREEIRDFSPQEKQALGVTLGKFTVEVADTLPLDAYHEEAVYGQPSFFEVRARDLARSRAALHEKGFPALAEMTARLNRQWHTHHRRGDFQPSIVGHYDLGPWNYRFARKSGSWRAVTAFDFASTQPTTPEQELRFVSLLGKDTIQAAVQSYEQETGRLLDLDLFAFWSLSQLAFIGVTYVIQKNKPVGTPIVDGFRHFAPEIDWAELDTSRD